MSGFRIPVRKKVHPNGLSVVEIAAIQQAYPAEPIRALAQRFRVSDNTIRYHLGDAVEKHQRTVLSDDKRAELRLRVAKGEDMDKLREEFGLKSKQSVLRAVRSGL